MSKVVAASAVGSYFEAIGLGANLRYKLGDWFVQGGFSDAKAESEIDFESLFDGVWSWTAEVGWMPKNLDQNTSVSLLAFSTDRTATLNRQTGWAIAATHDFGDMGHYGIFGRYTWADGGEGITPEHRENELPLKSGGFIGFAWNRPFGRASDQRGIAAIFGEPTGHRLELGYNQQYGIESFWRFSLGSFVRLSPSIQLLHSHQSDLEVVVGFRLKASEDFAKHFNSHQ